MNLNAIFNNNYRVYTLGGRGRTYLHKVADIFLPSGRLAILEGTALKEINKGELFLVNTSCGKFRVFATLAKHKTHKTLAYITIQFTDTIVARWEKLGEWFTDRGICILTDVTGLELLPHVIDNLTDDEWVNLVMSARTGGDASILLTPKGDINALIFRCGDKSYPIYIGYDSSSSPVYLVIDATATINNYYEEGILNRCYRYFLDRFG